MKKTKLLKSILVPTLGISAIVSIAAVSTSCGSEKNIENQYVAITANENSTFALTYKALGISVDLQYSKDKTNWSSYSNEISINQGQTLYLKGNNPDGWSQSRTVYSYLSITGSVSINGNVMGLLDNGAAPGKEGDITTIPCDYCFIGLFENSTGIKSVSEDFLPATTLAYGCYVGMFDGCISLTTPPKLPATNLAEDCYGNMFSGCSSLTVAPELPATSLTGYCYDWMFQNCSSLKVAPKLPATSLTENCYYGMFNNCTALTTAPELPATSLVSGCYGQIFDGCSSLNSIKIGYIGNYDSQYFYHWVDDIAGSGTFYYNGNQTAQNFQLPSGWTVPLQIYVAITANADSALTLLNNGGNNPDLKCSTDGANWTTYGSAININQGQKLYLKGNNPDGWSKSNTNYSYLSITGDVSISGNVMGLLDNGAKPGESGDITDIPCGYCFYDLFRNSTGIVSISEDFLPATNLKQDCYDGMFYQCTSLTTAPELPAITLAESCYRIMFKNCSALTTAPELPATTLADNCYRFMFYKCSSLNSIKIGYIGDYSDTYFNNWVTGVASSGTFYYDGGQTVQDFQLPSGWTVPLQIYVAITANEDSTLTLIHNGVGINLDLKCSTDAINWTTYGSTININQGETLYLKGNNRTGWSTSNSIYSHLSIKGNVSISGNVMALLDNAAKSGEEGDITDIPCNYCFYDLFRDSTGITSVSEDFLPATTLTEHCYDGMFYQCTSLTNAPKLSSMSLAISCYQHMFDGCTSLTTAPELPATTLANYCYAWMFQLCSALTTAPELPTTTLTDNCYRYMFYKCSSLNSIKIGYTGDYSDTYFNNWVTGVASSGTFYYNGNQTAQKFQLPFDWTTKKF